MLKYVGEGQFFNLIQKGFILFTVTVSLSLPRPLRKLLFISLLFLFFFCFSFSIRDLQDPFPWEQRVSFAKSIASGMVSWPLAKTLLFIYLLENFKWATGPLATGGPEMISGIFLYSLVY